MTEMNPETKIRCPWCVIFTRSCSGLCICDEPCGENLCPMRNADDYEPPPVPVFDIKKKDKELL